MGFGENLRALRRGKDTTQEELAAALSVAPQTISKWERGESYPDFPLLPPLAAYFDVSLDELVGMADYRSDEKRKELLKTGTNLCVEHKNAEAVPVLRDALALFPGDEEIMYWLAMSLYGLDSKDENHEAEPLLEKVAAGSQSAYRNGCRQRLLDLYKHTGRLEKAIEIAEQLPLLHEGREVIMSHLIDDGSRQEMEDLYHTLYWELDQALWRGVNRAKKAGDTGKVTYLLEKLLTFGEWFYDDPRDAEFLFASQYYVYAKFAELHIERGDTETALSRLEKAVKAAAFFPYNGVLISGVEDEAERESLRGESLKSLAESDYALSFTMYQVFANSELVRGYNVGGTTMSHPADVVLAMMSQEIWDAMRGGERFRAAERKIAETRGDHTPANSSENATPV